MKKLFCALLVLSFIIGAALTFSSCSRKTENEAKTEPESVDIVPETEYGTEPGPETDDAPPATDVATTVETPPASEDTETEIELEFTPIEPQPVEVVEVIDLLGGDTAAESDETAQTETMPVKYPEGSGTAPLALMYHLVLDEPYSKLESLFVRPSELRGHIEALLEKGYTFIFADEYDYYDGKTVIMSFDDGYLDNYTEVFPIIKEYNVKITIFMIANYIGGADYLTAPMIREMASSGLVSFQSHTATHAYLPSISADSMRHEFELSNSVIEELTGRPVKALCYPTGAYNAATVSIVKEYYDFAYTTVSRNSTAGFSLYELPRLRVNRGYSKDYFSALIP